MHFNILPISHHSHLIQLIIECTAGVSGAGAVLSGSISAFRPSKATPSSISQDGANDDASSVVLTPEVSPSPEFEIPDSHIPYKITALQNRAPANVVMSISNLNNRIRHLQGPHQTELRNQLRNQLKAILFAEQELAHLVFYGNITETTPFVAAKIHAFKAYLMGLLQEDISPEDVIAKTKLLAVHYQEILTDLPNYVLHSDVYDTYATSIPRITRILSTATPSSARVETQASYPSLVNLFTRYITQINENIETPKNLPNISAGNITDVTNDVIKRFQLPVWYRGDPLPQPSPPSALESALFEQAFAPWTFE